MSFFTAMAAGYVKEINNISKERAKKEREDELRAEEIQNQRDLVKYRVGLEQNNWTKQWEKQQAQRDLESQRTAFSALPDELQAAVIQNSKPEALQRLLGEGVSFGSVDLAAAMADVDNTSTIPGTTLPLPWEIDTETPENRNEVFVQNMNSWAASNTAAVLKHIAKNPTEAASMLTHLDQTMAALRISKYNTETEGERTILFPYEMYPDYMALRDELAARSGGVGSNEVVLQEDINIKTDGKGLGENEVFVYHPPSVFGKRGGEILTFEKEEYEYVSNFANVVYPGKDINYLLNNSASLMPEGTSYADALQGIKDAARLYDAGIMNLTSIAPDPEKVDAVADVLQEIGGPENTLSKQVAAVYPIFAGDPKRFAEYRIPGVISSKSGADYLGSSEAAAVSKRYGSAKRAVELATWLKQNRESLGTSGIARRLQEVAVGLFSKDGTVAQVSSFFTASPENLVEGTTAESINGIYTEYLKSQGQDPAGLIGETRVLEFNLAVQIARAADENGRLSNQDFENALKTLGTGGLFQSLSSDMGALDTTIALYTDVRDSLEQKNIIANKEKGQLVLSDIIEFAAYQAVKVGRQRIKERNAPGPAAPTGPVLPTLDQISQNPDVFKDYTSDFSVPQGTRFIYKRDDKSYYLISPEGNVSAVEKGNLPAPRTGGNSAAASPTPQNEVGGMAKDAADDRMLAAGEAMLAEQEAAAAGTRIPASDFAGLPSKPAPGGTLTFEGKPGRYKRVKIDGKFFYEKVN